MPRSGGRQGGRGLKKLHGAKREKVVAVVLGGKVVKVVKVVEVVKWLKVVQSVGLKVGAGPQEWIWSAKKGGCPFGGGKRGQRAPERHG